MGKKMVLTIFIVAVALGTEAEFQLRIGDVGAAADGALVPIGRCVYYLLKVALLTGTVAGGTAVMIGPLFLMKPKKKITKLRSAMAIEIFVPMLPTTISYTNNAMSRYASHLILIGIKNIKSISISGKTNAKARNRDILI